MALIGSPDYLELQQSNDTLINQAVTTIGAAVTTLGPFTASQWMGVAFSLATIGVDVQVTVSYFADDAATILLAQRSYGISAFNLTPNFWTAPVLGPYMTVGIQTNVGHAPACTLIAAGTQRIGPTFPVPNLEGLVEQPNLTLPAGVASIVDFSYLYAGPIHVSFNTLAATGHWELQWIDLTGTAHVLAQRVWSAAVQDTATAPIYVPPAHLQISVKNTTGAGSTGNLFVAGDAYQNKN